MHICSNSILQRKLKYVPLEAGKLAGACSTKPPPATLHPYSCTLRCHKQVQTQMVLYSMYALTFALICTGIYIRSATKTTFQVYDYI